MEALEDEGGREELMCHVIDHRPNHELDIDLDQTAKRRTLILRKHVAQACRVSLYVSYRLA